MDKADRFVISGNGIKEIGFFDEDKNFIKIDDMIGHLAINVFQSLYEIQKGNKKADETNIGIEISALNSLSRAARSLAEYAKIFRD